MAKPVGLIGIGLLGSALAERLYECFGYEIVGYDVLAERRQHLADVGGRAVDDVLDVPRQAEVIFLSLPHSGIVAAVIDAVRAELRPGTLVVDTTTGDPESTAALGQQLAAAGIDYLDATIAGSSQQARQGEAIVMCGGSPRAFERARCYLERISKQAFHVGPAGSGARMKLVVNLVLGLHRAVLAEGLALARALKLDWPAVLDVLKASPAYSTVMDTKGAKMLAGDFEPQARLAQHLKDVRLMLAAAERTGTELPLSSVHQQLLARLDAAGLGGLDNSAILRAFDL